MKTTIITETSETQQESSTTKTKLKKNPFKCCYANFVIFLTS